MSHPFVDIFITTKGRSSLAERSFSSFGECTPPDQYRLTVVDDTGDSGSSSPGAPASMKVDHIIIHRENLGLGPSINQALAHIDSLKRWDGKDAPPFTLYLQDDVIYSPGWLERLVKMFMLHESHYRLGFASGIESIEHPMRKDLGNGLILKDWIRATCMFARHEYWMSMWPISRIDPETGRERGKPGNGLGSSVDWWLVRNHENSVCRSGRTNLVIPGLLQHAGYRDSTWLARELPESESDKQKITRDEPKALSDIQIKSFDEGVQIDWGHEMVKDIKGG